MATSVSLLQMQSPQKITIGNDGMFIYMNPVGDGTYHVLIDLKYTADEYTERLDAIKKDADKLYIYYGLSEFMDRCDFLESQVESLLEDVEIRGFHILHKTQRGTSAIRDYLAHINILCENADHFIESAKSCNGLNVRRKLWSHQPEHLINLVKYESRVMTRFLERLNEILLYAYLKEKFTAAMCGYVYLFRLQTGEYKIGYSVDPNRRIKEVVGTLPIIINEVHRFYTNQMACAEYYLHWLYKKYHTGTGEWFNLEPQQVAEICAIKERIYSWVKESWE